MQIAIAALFTLGLTGQSVDFARFKTWWAFSPPTAVIVVGGLIATFGSVSGAAVYIAAQGLTEGEALSAQVAIGAIATAHAALRRFRSREPGGNYVFGLVGWALDAADQHVRDAIRRQLKLLSQDELLTAKDELALKMRRGVRSQKQVAQLVKIRKNRSDELNSTNEHVRALANTNLLNEVTEGWMQYRMGRRP